jgi:hypothetical protein
MSKFNILAKLGFCVAIPSLALIFYILTKRKEENFDEGTLFFYFSFKIAYFDVKFFFIQKLKVTLKTR